MEGLGVFHLRNHVKNFLSRSLLSKSKVVDTAIKINSRFLSQETTHTVENEEMDEIEKKRDVSRLPPRLAARMQHRRDISLSVRPEPALHWSNKYSLVWKQKRYGKFGRESGVDPGICWPSKERLAQMKAFEAENEATLQELMARVEAKKKMVEDEKRLKEETVLKNMSKMPQLIEQHKKMLKQKDSEVNKMSEKRERLLMEAREYFGYNIDPRDDKFKKMQEMKAEEYAKQKKLAKKQQKQLKIAADLEAQMKAATSKANEEQ